MFFFSSSFYCLKVGQDHLETGQISMLSVTTLNYYRACATPLLLRLIPKLILAFLFFSFFFCYQIFREYLSCFCCRESSFCCRLYAVNDSASFGF